MDNFTVILILIVILISRNQVKENFAKYMSPTCKNTICHEKCNIVKNHRKIKCNTSKLSKYSANCMYDCKESPDFCKDSRYAKYACTDEEKKNSPFKVCESRNIREYPKFDPNAGLNSNKCKREPTYYPLRETRKTCQKTLCCNRKKGKCKNRGDPMPLRKNRKGNKILLNQCQGHCESDRDCRVNLKCVKYTEKYNVPGCIPDTSLKTKSFCTHKNFILPEPKIIKKVIRKQSNKNKKVSKKKKKSRYRYIPKKFVRRKRRIYK